MTPDSQQEELRVTKPKLIPAHIMALLPGSKGTSEGPGNVPAARFQERLEGGPAGHSSWFLEICSAFCPPFIPERTKSILPCVSLSPSLHRVWKMSPQGTCPAIP